MKKFFFIAIILFLQPCFGQDWLQWGGPKGNFIVETKNLAENWPAEGPKLIWKRPLGEGYSTILYKDGQLYTMFSKGKNEIIISLDSKTGKLLWHFVIPVDNGNHLITHCKM
jgi:hypothetical protein